MVKHILVMCCWTIVGRYDFGDTPSTWWRMLLNYHPLGEKI